MFDTPYYVRVKHTGGLSGTTEWSSVCMFTTQTESGAVQGDNYVNPPTIVSQKTIDGVLIPEKYVSVFPPSVIQYQTDTVDVPLDPIINATPFGCDGSDALEGTITRQYKVALGDFSYTGLAQTYVSTVWELSDQLDFSTVILRTTDNLSYKKELLLPTLLPNTTYY